QPLSQREASAPDLAQIIPLNKPRTPDAWPDLVAQPVPEFNEALVPLDAPLSPLASALFHGYLALMTKQGVTVPTFEAGAPINGGEALAIVRETAGDLFPGLRTRTPA